MNSPALQTAHETVVTGGTTYVTFLAAGEIYGVPTASVREVLVWTPVTRIPNAGASVKGVINLRGEIIPVLDVRLRLGLPPVEPTERTCIVVMTVRQGREKLTAGLVVDTALEVTRLVPAQIEGGAEGSLAGAHVDGVARMKGGLVMLLNADSLVLDGADSPSAVRA